MGPRKQQGKHKAVFEENKHFKELSEAIQVKYL